MNKSIGKKGEQYAADYLRALGYEIVRTNYHILGGEIDIISRQDGEIVFVEVKTRRSNRYGLGEESISRTKLRRLNLAMHRYLLQLYWRCDYRLDVITIQMNSFEEVSNLRHYKNVPVT
ncbi:YraN family protein [Patescibacteria group bacterium]